MKKILVLFLSVMMAFSVSAQERVVAEFAEQTHDFGVVKEESRTVSYVFEFTNISQTPLTVKHVRASCGCTTPNWSKEPISPMGTGKINVTYTTIGRPGAFHKSITVILSNGTEDFTQILFIKGRVTPKDVEPIEETDATL